MEIFFIAGTGIAVFIELLLISKKNKSASDTILTLWMFLMVLNLFLFYIQFTGDIYNVPFLLGIGMPLPLLHGVFLYLYVCLLTNQLPKNKKLLVLHFIPVSAMYLYLVTFFMLPADQKIQIYKNQGAGYELFNSIKTFALSFSGMFYVIWSALLLRKHRNNIREQFSDLHKVNLQWLQVLTIGMGIIWLLVILFGNDTLIFEAVVIFIFFIGLFGVRQTNIFTQNETFSNDVDQKNKYSKSGLTEETLEKLHQRLLLLMKEEGLFKKSDLSISDLSTKLGVHPNYLSQIINQKEGKNFYDFVNMYRIEEFKRLIVIPKNQQLTLLSLAYDCGFNSKSSFNRYFKKTTGQTPSEYFTAVTKN